MNNSSLGRNGMRIAGKILSALLVLVLSAALPARAAQSGNGAEPDPSKGLKIATIFTYSQNEDDPEDAASDGGGDVTKLDKTSRKFLEDAKEEKKALQDQGCLYAGRRVSVAYR